MKATFHLVIGAMGMLMLFLMVYVVISQISPPLGDSVTNDIGQLASSLGNVIKP